MHQRSRLVEHTNCQHLSKQINGSCSSLSGAARQHDKLCDCVMFQNTPSLSRSQSRIGSAMAFPRINWNTITVTALAATAATTLSLRVLLVSILFTRRRRRVPSTRSTSPSSSTRVSLVSSVKTHFTKPPYKLDGRVCRGMTCHRENAHICARRLLEESEDDTGGTVPRPITRPCSWVWSSTWPPFSGSRRCWVSTSTSTWPRFCFCFCFCFFLRLDEHAADDEQARPPEELHEQARPSEESNAKVVQKHRDERARTHFNPDREK